MTTGRYWIGWRWSLWHNSTDSYLSPFQNPQTPRAAGGSRKRLSGSSRRTDLDVTGPMSDARDMALRSPSAIPDDLRSRLETARLDLAALFCMLDRLDLTACEIA